MSQLLLLLALVVPAIFFLITQERMLRIIQPPNRFMNPGMVWLQMIPIFGMAWQFWVVRKISSSISKEMEFVKDDSMLGISSQAIGQFNKKPTLAIGMAYCILITIGFLLNFFRRFTPNLLVVGSVFSLSGMVCWIVYWINLFSYKTKLKQSLVPIY